ncbi:FlgN protein [Alkalithermobacter thermoalcaliphilus JW-YL-7 = DSM 7308]|uniref:FlgN family protein n=1 Tax=Alkalithermobacter thermoalcaliphilus JW-YL-7 = DSM 7308 TaxID=1121328 RepID=A0A150FNC5_CLOPD|nr:FlgN family protein [[Clostridium] paradoxum JW-YL-7 = DSM 7308]SHL05790.1 FlgN protein [[Clostridium] paradoxum JW-YL-7 = DSM 7308]
MNSIDQFIQILDEQINLNNQLLSLSNEKKELIINNDAKKLNYISFKEQDIVKKIITLEKLRGAVLTNLERELNVDKITNIKQVIESVDKQKAIQIQQKSDKLKSILFELEKINDLNNKLIEFSLEYIQLNFNLLTSRPKPNNYGKKKENSISDTNFFDAKY